MFGRKRLVLTLQPAQVNAAALGYVSSGPLPAPLLLDSIIAETDTPSGLVYFRCGVSQGAVTTEALAASGQNIVDSHGSTISGGADAIPLPNGSVYITGIDLLIPQGLNRLWCAFDNDSASAIRGHVIFLGYWLNQSEFAQISSGVSPDLAFPITGGSSSSSPPRPITQVSGGGVIP